MREQGVAIYTEQVTRSYRVYQAQEEQGFRARIQGLLRRRYSASLGLHPLDLRIEQGEAVALVGPNGAGKTTLIKLLTGILTPTSGRVTCLGLNPTQERMRYVRQIGVVMGQRSLLWMNIPVLDTLLLYKEVYRLSDAQFKSRLAKLVDIFSFQDLLHRPVRQLSFGQRMRAELMASLLHHPKILFLDEPTIGLDVLSKRHLLEHIKNLRQEGDCTIILTSHDLHEVESLSERLVLLSEGQKTYDGSLRSFVAPPSEEVVLQLERSVHEAEELTALCHLEGLPSPHPLSDEIWEVTCPKEREKDLMQKFLALESTLQVFRKRQTLTDAVVRRLEEKP